MKKIMSKAILAGSALVASASVSMAALTVDQQAVVDATDTMITDMTTVAWSMILAVTGTFIAIKVFKKFINKATS